MSPQKRREVWAAAMRDAEYALADPGTGQYDSWLPQDPPRWYREGFSRYGRFPYAQIATAPAETETG